MSDNIKKCTKLVRKEVVSEEAKEQKSKAKDIMKKTLSDLKDMIKELQSEKKVA